MTAVDDAFPHDPAAHRRADGRTGLVPATTRLTAREVTPDGHPTLRHTVGPRPGRSA